MKSRNPSIKLEDIAQGMIACRSNARELLEEVDILLSHRRIARAYALLHTSCEELAKFSVLELGGRRLALGNPPNWKRFWQRFRSHDSKIAQLDVQMLLLMEESESLVHRDVVSAAKELFDLGIIVRNSALYVDTGPDDRFRRPSDIDYSVPLSVLQSVAKLALDAADRRGQTIEDVERNLGMQWSDSRMLNALKVFVESLKRMRDAGLEEGDVRKMLDKSFNK